MTKFTLKETKLIADETYKIGFEHGAIEMKNEILKKLNRDRKLFGSFKKIDSFKELLDKIDKIKPQQLKPHKDMNKELTIKDKLVGYFNIRGLFQFRIEDMQGITEEGLTLINYIDKQFSQQKSEILKEVRGCIPETERLNDSDLGMIGGLANIGLSAKNDTIQEIKDNLQEKGLWEDTK